MRLTHCDRCGKLFTPERDKIYRLPVRTPLFDSTINMTMCIVGSVGDYLDLCESCNNSFMSWWSEHDNKKEKRE